MSARSIQRISLMHAVLLTFHTLVVLAIIVVVLLQRSDGGALGLGGGGGGFMTSRGAANVLTRTTSVLAALFFATSLALAVTAGASEKDADIIRDLTGEKVQDPNAPVTTEDLLNTLGGSAGETAPAPESAIQSSTPPALEATPAPADAPAEETPAPDTDAPEAPQP